MFNNLIANLISNIRVAIQHKRQSGSSHYSKFALTILNKLQEKNIVGKITIENKKNRKYICFDLPNYNYTYFISEIFGAYKSSAQYYFGYRDIPKLLQKHSEGLISTNIGVLYLHECMSKKVGGRLILLYR